MMMKKGECEANTQNFLICFFPLSLSCVCKIFKVKRHFCVPYQRQTGISVSYRKGRYQGLWYQYQYRSGTYLSLGINISLGWGHWTIFCLTWKDSLLSKVSVSISVPGHFPGISISIGLDSNLFQVSVSVSVSIQSQQKYQYQYRIEILGPVCLWTG